MVCIKIIAVSISKFIHRMACKQLDSFELHANESRQEDHVMDDLCKILPESVSLL